MAITIADATGSVGAGARGPLQFGGHRSAKLKIYSITLDADQATGGEDITSCFNDFTEVLFSCATQVTGTIANIRLFTVDHTNKTLIGIKTLSAGANAEEVDSLDTIVVKLVLIGY